MYVTRAMASNKKIILTVFCVQVLMFFIYVFKTKNPVITVPSSTISPSTAITASPQEPLTPAPEPLPVALLSFADTYTSYTVRRLQMKQLNDVKSIRPEFGHVINDVTSFNNTVPFEKCRVKTNGFKQSVFIGIVTAPDNFARRQTIRSTWLRHV